MYSIGYLVNKMGRSKSLASSNPVGSQHDTSPCEDNPSERPKRYRGETHPTVELDDDDSHQLIAFRNTKRANVRWIDA